MTIHTLGDSHSSAGWKDVVVHHLSGTLCYSFGKEPLNRCNPLELGLKDGDTLIFCFGEIDCRCHVHKHRTDTLSYQEILNGITDRYFEAIALVVKTCKVRLKDVCVYNVVPPVHKDRAFGNSEYPYLGTDQERKEYVLYFNKRLKETCIEKGYLFVDIYDKYADEDGFLRRDLSDDSVHIKDGRFLSEFLEQHHLR